MRAAALALAAAAASTLSTASCGEARDGSLEVEARERAGAAPTWVSLPRAATRAREPELVVLAPDGGGHALRLHASTGARDLARGERWFVNWADVPAAARDAQGTTWATWLERTGDGAYDYAIWIGSEHAAPRRLHDDVGLGEHGFVSLAPMDEGGLVAAWLDGRDHAKPNGAMRVQARFIDSDGRFGAEILLDERACDCCPTSLTARGDGALVAWRDRDVDERRDIALAHIARDGTTRRIEAGLDDGWRIHGCPVNGAALASDGTRVALVRYTEGGGEARVVLSTAEDPRGPWRWRVLARGGVLGRLDASCGPDGSLSVLWLERVEGAAAWMLARWDSLDADAPPVVVREVARTTADRSSGRARVVDLGSHVRVATPVPGGVQVVHWRP
jgi:hypothetical protein